MDDVLTIFSVRGSLAINPGPSEDDGSLGVVFGAPTTIERWNVEAGGNRMIYY